ncbi:insulinase family protein [Colwellia sp. KU-HH00111]|uniref:insulinase family protein n=1 Tax=Colwellia sp. KU-HH00111 TaxID=3127652 RepID=UPI0033658CED
MNSKNNITQKFYTLLSFIACSLMLSACSIQQFSLAETASPKIKAMPQLIKQSKYDNRHYKVLRLPNKLELILVSDASLERSAVALAVKAGSYDETNGFWGQAHFLEHMLFLGTEKYPEVGSFNTFISSNGGMNNAYTDMDHTNYMASIKNNAFEGLLDRFSDYFKAPLLAEKYINKERNAVNSEWSMKGVYDGVILGHLNGLTLNPIHPVANFTWGNLSSLKDQNGQTLHQATIDFYNQFYQANRMKVALVSNRSITELEVIAKKYFAAIKDNNIKKSAIIPPAITEAQTKKIIRYKPQKDLKKIQLKFVIENNAEQFLSKPNYYVSYLLNSKMPGTLVDTLKTEGLIEGLSAWADPSAFGNSGEFFIDIDLTEQGLKQRNIIINSVFKYLTLINQEGLSRKYYQEIKQSLQNSFDYQSKYSEYSYAANLAAKMHEVPTKYTLSADYEFSHFSPENIKHLLAQLTINRVRVFYIDNKQTPQQPIGYFDAKYQIDDILPSQIQQWQNTNSGFPLNLPALNSLLPENFDLVKTKLQPKPTKISTPLGSVLHVKHSEQFSVAKGGININLNTNLGTKSANEQALLLLLHKAITDKISPLKTEAYNAGMSLQVNHQQGLTLISAGFTNKQLELQSKAINALTSISFNDKSFNHWKKSIQTSLHNKNKDALYNQAFEQYNTFLIEGKYPAEDLLKTLSKLKLNDLTAFADNFIQSVRINAFAFGNFDQSQLNHFVKSVETSLKVKATNSKAPIFFTQYHKFSDNEKVNIKVNAQQNDVALIDAKWQKHTVKKEAVGKVLAKIVSPALFKQIRTEEQLGYSVGFYTTVKDGQITYAWYIQTPVKSPTKMLARFKAFQANFSDDITSLNSDTLEKYRQAVLVSLTQKPKNIYQEQSEYLSDWQTGKLTFDSKQKLIDAIKKVTVKEIQHLYQQVITPNELAHIIVQIKGSNFAKAPFIQFKNNTDK